MMMTQRNTNRKVEEEDNDGDVDDEDKEAAAAAAVGEGKGGVNNRDDDDYTNAEDYLSYPIRYYTYAIPLDRQQLQHQQQPREKRKM